MGELLEGETLRLQLGPSISLYGAVHTIMKFFGGGFRSKLSALIIIDSAKVVFSRKRHVSMISAAVLLEFQLRLETYSASPAETSAHGTGIWPY